MNQLYPSTVPWPTSDTRDHSTDAAAPHDDESTQPATAALVMNAGHGDDHHTVERTTDGAEHAMQTLDGNAAATEKTIPEKAPPRSEAQAKWASGVRTTVRRHPMVSVTAAFAMGALIVRMAR